MAFPPACLDRDHTAAGALAQSAPLTYTAGCSTPLKRPCSPASWRLRSGLKSTAPCNSPCCSGPKRGSSSPGRMGCGSSAGRRPDGASGAGVRVIYYWAPDWATIHLLYIYAKNEQGDLTPTQAKALARLVREEFG